MTDRSSSSPGASWSEWYAKRGLWWVEPGQLTDERLQAFAGEQWVGAIAAAADIGSRDHLRVLEAGCGSAQYGLALAARGCDVDALDVNPAALARAAEVAAGVGRAAERLTLAEGDLLDLPTGDDTYDLVFNQQVMEYFDDETVRRRALAEMTRTAKPGGHVVIVVARPDHPFAPWWRLTGWRGFTDQPDMIELDAPTLEADLASVGLVDVRTDGIAPWRALAFWPRWHERWGWTRRAVGTVIGLLERVPLPRWARRRFGLQTLAVGTKPDLAVA
jgi:SAM-dependent methyltransferase